MPEAADEGLVRGTDVAAAHGEPEEALLAVGGVGVHHVQRVGGRRRQGAANIQVAGNQPFVGVDVDRPVGAGLRRGLEREVAGGGEILPPGELAHDQLVAGDVAGDLQGRIGDARVDEDGLVDPVDDAADGIANRFFAVARHGCRNQRRPPVGKWSELRVRRQGGRHRGRRPGPPPQQPASPRAASASICLRVERGREEGEDFGEGNGHQPRFAVPETIGDDKIVAAAGETGGELDATVMKDEG